MGILKMSEWQDGAGHWHCADVSNLVGGSSLWWKPARMLNIPLDKYVEMLVKDFKVDYITYLDKSDMVYFWWDSQTNMRKYKNYMNKVARERRFQV